ncbi:MAG TPA: hypothetical protein VIS72_03470 [Anaerolineales bacterium]
MTKAAGVMHKQSERGQQGHGAGDTKAQARGALTLCGEGRLHNTLNTFLGEMTVVTDMLDVQQTSIDFSTNLLQEGQIRKIQTNAEVFWIIDDGFRAQGPVFLEVLFHQGFLVFNVQIGVDARLDHTGAEATRSRADDLAIKNKLHSIGTTQIQVLLDNRFEEFPAADRIVKDLRACG